MAKIFHAVMGEFLPKENLCEKEGRERLPSPHELQGKIILKGSFKAVSPCVRVCGWEVVSGVKIIMVYIILHEKCLSTLYTCMYMYMYIVVQLVVGFNLQGNSMFFFQPLAVCNWLSSTMYIPWCIWMMWYSRSANADSTVSYSYMLSCVL